MTPNCFRSHHRDHALSDLCHCGFRPLILLTKIVYPQSRRVMQYSTSSKASRPVAARRATSSLSAGTSRLDLSQKRWRYKRQPFHHQQRQEGHRRVSCTSEAVSAAPCKMRCLGIGLTSAVFPRTWGSQPDDAISVSKAPSEDMSLSDFGKQQPAKAQFPLLTKLLVSAMILLFVYQVRYMGSHTIRHKDLLSETSTQCHSLSCSAFI